MLKQDGVAVVTTHPVYIGHAAMPFPPGTALTLTAEQAEHLIGEGHALSPKDYDQHLKDEKQKQDREREETERTRRAAEVHTDPDHAA